MKLPTEIFGDVVVVHTPEELGATRPCQLETFLTSLERSNVIVDLDGSETIDSGGLEALLTAQEALRALQRRPENRHQQPGQPQDPRNHAARPAARSVRHRDRRGEELCVTNWAASLHDLALTDHCP